MPINGTVAPSVVPAIAVKPHLQRRRPGVLNVSKPRGAGCGAC